MITNADMTLYQRHGDKDGETYVRSFIPGVNWQEKKHAAMVANGLVTEDTSNVFVPFSSSGSVIPRNGDYAVRGQVSEEITEIFRIKSLLQKYPDAGKVISVTKNDNGSRRNRHYELEVKR
jgi:hypothetical protein